MAEKKKVTANGIYDLLLNEFKIKEQIGSVEIILGGICWWVSNFKCYY